MFYVLFKYIELMVIIQFRPTTSNIDVIIDLIDEFLHETKESDRNKRRFVSRSKILIVDHFTG